jgi:UDP-glucose 4-epimerase
MKCVVTGGAGFIGSHLVDRLLALGHEVIVLDNLSTGRIGNLSRVTDRIRFREADLGGDVSWTEEFKEVDWVFHLAALADIVPSIQSPESYFQSNVTATLNVLQASVGSNVRRFIYVASSSSYGFPVLFPTPESAAINPQYPYALTKHMGEELVLHWSQVYGLPALSLRLFNVYGPRSRTSGTYGAVFGVFLAQKLAGEPFTVVGDGLQTRDFTYVSDIVSALLAAVESDRSQSVYNVGSGASVSVNRLAELLGGEKVFIPKRPAEPDHTFADISRIQFELGWHPEVSIEQGVSQLLEEIDYWRTAPVWTPNTIAEATRDWFRYLGSSEESE